MPHTIKQLIDQRLLWLKTHQYSPRTEYQNSRYLDQFWRWCIDQEIRLITEITPKVMESYRAWVSRQCSVSDEPWSLGYQRALLSSLHCCLRWAYQQGYFLINPTEKSSLPPKPKQLPGNVLSLRELKQILEMPDLTTPLGLRDRAILEVFCATAIRRQELLNLTLNDLDLKNGLLYIRQGKGNQDRVVPISERAFKWIYQYQRQAREILLFKAKSPSQFLFLNRLGEPLGKIGCNRRLRAYIQEVAPHKKGSCHLIRHSIATLLLEQGCQSRYIQEFLGHRQLETTQIYTKISIQHLREVYERLHPSALSLPPFE